jgi:acetylornithine/N-succinyldiaminopimelate aminotransferase
LAATGQDHYHELFQPLTPGFQMVHAGDFDEFREACETRKVAGILLECIQGEGGVRDVPAGYLCAVASYCREHDLVLMVDEVQAGNGRTGKLYSYEHCGIEPDVVTTAKGLGGGLPIGACLLGDKVQHVLGAGDHGSTFGGNPVVCAGALSILRRLDDAFLAQVTAKGERMREVLTGAPGITAVTGKGLMVGLQTGKPADQVVQDCLAGGVLCLTAKDRVRLLPPPEHPRRGAGPGPGRNPRGLCRLNQGAGEAGPAVLVRGGRLADHSRTNKQRGSFRGSPGGSLFSWAPMCYNN